MASVWGGDDPSVAWGQNTWESNTITQAVTGYGLTCIFRNCNWQHQCRLGFR